MFPKKEAQIVQQGPIYSKSIEAGVFLAWHQGAERRHILLGIVSFGNYFFNSKIKYVHSSVHVLLHGIVQFYAEFYGM